MANRTLCGGVKPGHSVDKSCNPLLQFGGEAVSLGSHNLGRLDVSQLSD
jgi:hypothetical protein